MEEITILSLLQEMQSFVSIDKNTIDLARESKISYNNNSELKRLSKEWSIGNYDEDPQLLVDELIRLL